MKKNRRRRRCGSSGMTDVRMRAVRCAAGLTEEFRRKSALICGDGRTESLWSTVLNAGGRTQKKVEVCSKNLKMLHNNEKPFFFASESADVDYMTTVQRCISVLQNLITSMIKELQ